MKGTHYLPRKSFKSFATPGAIDLNSLAHIARHFKEISTYPTCSPFTPVRDSQRILFTSPGRSSYKTRRRVSRRTYSRLLLKTVRS